MTRMTPSCITGRSIIRDPDRHSVELKTSDWDGSFVTG